jgi:hypothetical protein
MTIILKSVLIFCLFLTADISMADPAEITPIENSLTAAATCLPEVIIHTLPSPWSFCLNTLAPGPDSCIDITIDGSRHFGAQIHFSRSDSVNWQYRGMTFPDSGTIPADVRIELNNGSDGNLVQAQFYPQTQYDSLTFPPQIRIENDRPAPPDTSKPDLNIAIYRTVTDCQPKRWKVVVEERHYSYPPGFRRDPVLNYPELSMFHYGRSVRMPTARSLENRAQLFLYWHTMLDPLKFEDSEEVWRKEAVYNKFRKPPQSKPEKPKKPPPVTFKPLQ